MKKTVLSRIITVLAILAVLGVVIAAGVISGGQEGALNATIWALIPPIVAIALALITKRYIAPCSWASWSVACSTPASNPRQPCCIFITTAFWQH